MQVLRQKILTDYCRHKGDSKLTIRVNAWIQEAKAAKWQNSQDLKSHYPKASIITKKDVAFDLLGNKYRLWIKVNYSKAGYSH